jgi:hypothetical protein
VLLLLVLVLLLLVSVYMFVCVVTDSAALQEAARGSIVVVIELRYRSVHSYGQQLYMRHTLCHYTAISKSTQTSAVLPYNFNYSTTHTTTAVTVHTAAHTAAITPRTDRGGSQSTAQATAAAHGTGSSSTRRSPQVSARGC